ncbi:PriCT-2 domain-containing protein [Xanthomonas sacchari]|uniref:PriCT-2 domain-containing protein n=1 Tax=Xanthomonas sacchari TaxID=56458 RepID=UPI0020C52D2E|nr:PriCT-2 domain-containing protein [Xanthomonas sacchari]
MVSLPRRWPEVHPRRTEAEARRADRAKKQAIGAGELTPEQLAETLAQLDPCDFGEKQHDRWRDLMMACHFATDGEGRQEFIDWCMGDGHYLGQEWIVGRRPMRSRRWAGATPWPDAAR